MLPSTPIVKTYRHTAPSISRRIPPNPLGFRLADHVRLALILSLRSGGALALGDCGLVGDAVDDAEEKSGVAEDLWFGFGLLAVRVRRKANNDA
jgi:hypothetical protein